MIIALKDLKLWEYIDGIITRPLLLVLIEKKLIVTAETVQKTKDKIDI